MFLLIKFVISGTVSVPKRATIYVLNPKFMQYLINLTYNWKFS